MTPTKYILILALLLTGLVGLILRDMKKASVAQNAAVTEPQKLQASAQGFNDKAAWSNEPHWLVDEVVRDMAEMLAFAASDNPKSFKPSSLKVETLALPASDDGTEYALSLSFAGHDIQPKLKLVQHLWSAEHFAPLAKAILEAWKIKTPTSTSKGSLELATTLLKPVTPTLVAESKRVSEALTKAPLDPSLHEQAALLLGTLALRDAAGRFSDVRLLLCRMAAHLALARAVAPEDANPMRQLADAVQLTLLLRQADALAVIDKLPAEFSAWSMALRLRNTYDWRLLAKPASASLLEQIEYAYALAGARDPTAIEAFLEEAKPEPLADWTRIALEPDISVAEGHVFATNSVSGEFAATAELRAAWSGAKPKDLPALLEVLNVPPHRGMVRGDADGKVTDEATATARLEVLSWGMLADFHQRHLCHALDRTQYFFRDRWGVPEEAAALETMVSSKLKPLRLHPLLQVVCDDDEPESADMTAYAHAIAFCDSEPQHVSSHIWTELMNPKRPRGASAMPPSPDRWFSQGLLFGTAYDYCGRDCGLHCSSFARRQFDIASLVKIAPYHHHVLQAASRAANESGAEALLARFKAIEPYHLAAARSVASQLKHDPDAYVAAMERIAQMDPDTYITLAQQLANMGREEQAAKAWESAYARAPGQVKFANNCRWVIDYYFDHDRKEDALRIANRAAEVYSFRGLESAAHLMVRMERWDEAYKHLAAIAERYENEGPLMAFLMQHKDGHPEVAKHYDTYVKKVFPDGLKAAVLKDFKEAPQDGVTFTSSSALMQPFGIEVGHVVVALDGYAVHNLDQYMTLRSLKPDAALELIVWDGTKFKEVSASVPERRFNCEMESYLKR